MLDEALSRVWQSPSCMLTQGSGGVRLNILACPLSLGVCRSQANLSPQLGTSEITKYQTGTVFDETHFQKVVT